MRIQFPEWRRENEATRYPFSSRATLVNDEGRVVVEGAFLDAALYPAGGVGGFFLAAVTLTSEEVTFTVGDDNTRELASGTVSVVDPPDLVPLEDAAGRPAGVLVSESARLGTFQSWGVGTHEFDRAQSEFCPTVCFPAPALGLRGVRLESGEVFAGDVWLVGADGVVLRADPVTLPAADGLPERPATAIRVDVVGDPLFRRRLCENADLFATPRFVRTVRFVGPNQTFDCAPDAFGDVKIFGNNALAADTVLRVVATAGGVRIGAAGQGI
ncbi:MAG TPA: hypothetical protein VNC22_01315 [Sporichthya sp.]|jgi:hypothetical protein|nr:hypothetical protein [Sporichthya sp.]